MKHFDDIMDSMKNYDIELPAIPIEDILEVLEVKLNEY